MVKKKNPEKRKAVTIHIPVSTLEQMRVKAKDLKMKRKVLVETMAMRGWNDRSGFYA